MMQKMRIEMAYIVESLYTDFEESFRAQRETIIADFNGIMRFITAVADTCSDLTFHIFP